MDSLQAISHIFAGESILIVGSGFSVGALDSRGKELILGKGLRAFFHDICELEDDGASLEDISNYYVSKFGVRSCIDVLASLFTVSMVQDYHKEIVLNDWSCIYTTNYDNVIEFSHDDIGIVSYNIQDGTPSGLAGKFCMHINGFARDIKKMDDVDFGKYIKLTEKSYALNSFCESSWGARFVDDVALAKSVFIVGYSLFDVDICRLLRRVPHLQEKTFFVLGEACSEVLKAKIAEYGQSLDCSAADFATLLCEQKAKSERKVNLAPKLYHSTRYSTPHSVESDNLNLSMNQLVFSGMVDSRLVWDSVFGACADYYLLRGALDDVYNNLKMKQAVVVESSVCNGKTLLLEGLKAKISSSGVSVYDINNSQYAKEEISNILKASHDVCLFFDDYPQMYDFVEFAKNRSSASVRFVLAARSAIHEVLEQKVCNLFNGSIASINIDKLQPTDVDLLIDIYKKHGLWGRHLGGLSSMRRFVSQKCEGSFSLILLEVFKSKYVSDKIAKILRPAEGRHDILEFLYSVLVFSVLGRRVTLSAINTLLGAYVSYDLSVVGFEALKHFVVVKNGRIFTPPSVIAQHILNVHADAKILTHVLVKLAKAAHKSSNHVGLFTELMRFGNLQLLLPKMNMRHAALDFYEGLRSLSGCSDDYFFWLQYAIACLAIEEFERAERFFETTYACAKKRGVEFNTFQVDNHYARFILVSSSALMRDNFFDLFRKAKTIINGQLLSSNRDRRYACRSARYLPKFIVDNRDRMSPVQYQEAMQYAMHLFSKIESFDAVERSYTDVRICYDNLKDFMEKYC